jgi:hypothetical protein
MDHVSASDPAQNAVTTAEGGSTSTRKGPNCAFHLINVLLSDQFRELFGNLYAPQDCDLLESGLPLRDDEYFWTDVQAAYVNVDHPLNATDFSSLHSNRVEFDTGRPTNQSRYVLFVK